MANGLAVVSIRIPVLEKAAISHALTFYNEPSGLSLATAIQNALLVDNRKIVNILNNRFVNSIKSIFANNKTE